MTEIPDKSRQRRALRIWLFSYVSIGLLLFFYGGVPLLPLLAGGVLTLVLTIVLSRR